MVSLAVTIMALAHAGGALAQTCGTTVLVTDANLGDWADNSIGGANVAFVPGPATPPLGTGSAEFRVGPNGDDAAQLRNSAYEGTKLSQLTTLSYSTYVQDNLDGQAPYIILNVDLDGDLTTTNDRDLLFFEPVYQSADFFPTNPQGPVALNTWQTWDALNGGWWSLNGTAGATPGTGVKPLSIILASFPNASIVNTTSGGGVRLVAGFGAGAWDDFVGNADAFKIGVAGCTTTYNFEPAVGPPTDKNQCKNNGWKKFNNPAFKNQGQCVSFVASGGKSGGKRQ
jgi:hypothetical protein